MTVCVAMTRGERTDHRPLGWCPRCRKAIPDANLLIRYEDPTTRTVFAQCTNCDHVVTPRTDPAALRG